MQISVPLTGTLISYNPPLGAHDDPVRIVNLDLGNVRWQLVSLDFEHDLALIEVTPAEEGDFPTGERDGDGNIVYERRRLTSEEKQDLLRNAKAKVFDKTIDELYLETKSPKLKKPKQAV